MNEEGKQEKRSDIVNYVKSIFQLWVLVNFIFLAWRAIKLKSGNLTKW